MKTKILISSLLIASISHVAFGKNGIFVGAELGGGFIPKAVPSGSTQYTYGIDYGLGWGVRLGYLHNFTPMNALRVYASYGQNHLYPITGASNKEGSKAKYDKKYGTGFRADLNVDYILNYIHTDTSTAGIYVGGFVGYSEWDGTYYRSDKTRNTSLTEIRKGLGYGINIGITTSVATHHIIDFGAKIPLGGASAKVDVADSAGQKYTRSKSWKNGFVGLSYSYIF